MYFFTRILICCISLTSFSFSLFDHEYPERHVSLANSDDLTLSENMSSYRLPTNVKPTGYYLTLRPLLNNGTVEGWVTIIVDVLVNTSSLVLNVDTDFIKWNSTDVSVISATQVVTIVNSSVDKIHQMVTLMFNDTLVQQRGVSVQISYYARLGTDMLGLYESTYSTGSVNHIMGITQFESTYARRVFPCFDEPAYRANFTIKIYRLLNQTSMSNMPLSSSQYDNATGMMLDSYETSPAMPTYLVALGVSELSNKSSTETFRVFAREDAIDDASYVLAIGQPILDCIGNMLSYSYPLPKMDVVAVPDFAAGAMENWGLTTFREKYVLFDPVKNSWRDKFGVLSVVAHEFGHQWFGDLVTPAWWDYTWLNEAFATYFEYFIPDSIEPDWNVGSAIYVMDAVQLALHMDTGNPRPMTFPVYTPEQIENNFDYVIYEKGGSVLRMIENFLSTDVWKRALNQYLTINAYKTVTPEKLFSALGNEANKTGMTHLNETLQGWTTQPGYPLVTVTLVNSTGNCSTYKITQVPYLLSGHSSNLTWNVPLRYTTELESIWDPTKANLHWLLSSDPTTSFLTVNGSGYILFNLDQVGYYRVNYDAQNWNMLKDQLNLNHSVICSPINRGQIVDDILHLAYSNHTSYSDAFALTKYLQKEDAVVPLNAFVKNMRDLVNMFDGTATGDGLKKYSRQIMADPFCAMVANSTQAVSTSIEGYKLGIVSSFACEVGVQECTRLANQLFTIWLKNTSGYVIPPDIKQTVICTGLRMDSSQSTFMNIFDYYLNSNNAAEKLTVMTGLGCLNNEVSTKTYLDYVCDVNTTKVRPQDRWIAFRTLLSHQTGITAGLNYMANNYDKICDAMSGADIQKIISTVANTISQPTHINQVQSMLNDNSVDSRFRSLLNSTVIPAVNKRMSWMESAPSSDLKGWVEDYIRSSAVVSVTAINVLLTLVPAVFIILNY